MKFLIVVAFVSILIGVHSTTLSDEQKVKGMQYIALCKEQEKISDDQIAKLRSGDFSDIGDDVKCFANCFLEQADVVKDGVLQEDVVLEKFGPTVGEDKAKQILDLCRGETGANKCETSFKLLSCLRQNKGILLE